MGFELPYPKRGFREELEKQRKAFYWANALKPKEDKQSSSNVAFLDVDHLPMIRLNGYDQKKLIKNK